MSQVIRGWLDSNITGRLGDLATTLKGNYRVVNIPSMGTIKVSPLRMES